MEYIDRIMAAVAYMESRLDRKTTVQDIAHQAGYSKFHFQRLFHQVTNYTVGQYMTARKLTEAAKTLRLKNYRIIDVSYMHGFESHETFTRAFKSRFGVLPNEWRASASGRIPPNLMMGELRAEYLAHIRQLEAEALELAVPEEIAVRGYRTDAHSVASIFQCWERLFRSCRDQQGEKFGIVQYADQMEFEADYTYLAAAREAHMEKAEEQCLFTVPVARYIVFEHRGSVEKLPLTYRYIYGTWFAQQEVEPGGSFDFEYYGEHFRGLHETASGIRIYVPVA
ncbi:helix-turn-helix domain-containing protein [Paenibacillus sp. J5C_2022]|uniref:helix-turn-helix domain-containing protein n=1 Tax=Paenibacillus sp. J5C2022 TaxID=2977129 RepID=UPI0021CFA0C6|nr:helix-turn-helix domain-containing protein [Paenibacillus sp. J5C2022]MCU6708702.1 helix-turn-helix domain-containing protein [Paenibacillus sp. J5C2022]